MTQLPNSYSRLSSLAKCPRKYFYGYELGLEEMEPGVSRKAGQSLHAGLHVLHLHGVDALEEAIEAMEEDWGSFRVPPAHRQAFMTRGHLENVLRNYVTDRGDFISNSRALPFGDFQAEELAGAFIGSDSGEAVEVTGRIDLPTKIGENLALIDHKTTSDWLSSWWAEQFEFSHQLRIYVAMLREITNLPFDRAYINGLHVGPAASDPDSAWTKRKSPRSSLYGPYIFSPSHLDETADWVRRNQDQYRLLKQLEETLDKEKVWYQNDTARGCQGCEFRQVCRAAPVIRRGIMAKNYTRKEGHDGEV